ncbi:serine hydrolase domain-containing protein [candidate division KSB1 bacterium]
MKKIIYINFYIICFAVLLLLNCSDKKSNNPYSPEEPSRDLHEFEERLEMHRLDLYIPGMSAAITKNGKVVWNKCFGVADVENEMPVTPNTCFRLSGLTETFAATVVLQLVEEGIIDLESRIIDYGIVLQSDGIAKVKHLFSHTSIGVPGEEFIYNGYRFSMLDEVLYQTTGKRFAVHLAERISEPLGLEFTGPAIFIPEYFSKTGVDFGLLLNNLAFGYTSDGAERMNYPEYFSPEAGLISTAVEVAEYSIALDNNIFFSEETKERLFSPAISNNGEEFPYGFGWFVQQRYGVKIVWHFGWWNAISSLIIKVPEKELTFVMLANNDMLSRAYSYLQEGDITVSSVAMEFLNAFVYGDAELPDLP